jgi:hypothetical protein
MEEERRHKEKTPGVITPPALNNLQEQQRRNIASETLLGKQKLAPALTVDRIKEDEQALQKVLKPYTYWRKFGDGHLKLRNIRIQRNNKKEVLLCIGDLVDAMWDAFDENRDANGNIIRKLRAI